MAIIKCNECGKDISDTAKICVHCGAKTETTKTKNKNILIISIISIIIILIISSMILININNPLNKYKRQVKKTINDYLNNKITVDVAKNQIDNIAKQINIDSKEKNEIEKIEYSNLSISLHVVTWDLTTGNIAKVKQFVNDL